MNRNNRQNKNRMVSITAFIIAAAGILLSLLLQIPPGWQMIKYMVKCFTTGSVTNSQTSDY